MAMQTSMKEPWDKRPVAAVTVLPGWPEVVGTRDLVKSVRAGIPEEVALTEELTRQKRRRGGVCKCTGVCVCTVM